MTRILFSVAVVSTLVLGFSMGDAVDSVDTNKAKESVDTQKAMAAVSKGSDITLKDVKESVNSDKAVESVDKAKLAKSLF